MNTNEKYQPAFLELHVGPNPDFTKRFGKRVKEIGGKYSHCRGYHGTRFVTVPNTETGRELAQDILDIFGSKPTPNRVRSCCIIMRGGGLSRIIGSWVFYTRDVDEAFQQLARRFATSVVQDSVKRRESEDARAEERKKKQEEIARQIQSLLETDTMQKALRLLVEALPPTNVDLTDADYGHILSSAVAKSWGL